MDGVIVIRKEKGFTSHDVVAKLRGILHMKKSDIQELLIRMQKECSRWLWEKQPVWWI